MHRLKQLFGRSETPNIGENSGDVFQYTPLKEPSNFRILCLHNSFMGANRDHKGLALRGSLIEASIHSPPKYFALSYCWGDPALSEEIILDGQILNVTASCASALRRMLRGKLGRHIWVDSICINQSITPEALKERSTQVEMMDRIYRHATQVNVYLGDGDAASDVACRSIRELFLAAVAASLSGSTQGALRRKYDRLADDVLSE
jgi:hypothetical protein